MNKHLNKLIEENPEQKELLNFAFAIGFDFGRKRGFQKKLQKLTNENIELSENNSKLDPANKYLRTKLAKIEKDNKDLYQLNCYYKKVVDGKSINQLKMDIKILRAQLVKLKNK